MRIANVGTIDWTSGQQFTLAKHRQVLRARLEAHRELLQIRRTQESRDELAEQIRRDEEALTQPLPIVVRIFLDEPIPDDQLPLDRTDVDNGCEWKADSSCPTDRQQVHPILYLIRGLARTVNQSIKVELFARLNVYLTFYSQEDVRSSTPYIIALARKMERWAAEGQPEVLSEKELALLETTQRELETAARAMRDTVETIRLLQTSGVEADFDAEELAKVVRLCKSKGHLRSSLRCLLTLLCEDDKQRRGWQE